MQTPTLPARLGAEALGTFWLVFGGCGSAIFAAKYLTDDKTQLGIGFVGVALAFGLTVLTMAYAVGHVSGGHFNPAVTVGLWAAKRFEGRNVLPYVVVQVIGAIAAAAALFLIADGGPGFEREGNFLAANGFGTTGSPGQYSMLSGIVVEVVFTAVFLWVILGVTDRRAPTGFAPLGIGLSLALIHLVTIPVTNTSVNPARSTGPALFVGGDWLGQLWFFWLFPIVGALIGAGLHRALSGHHEPGDAEIS